VITPEEQRFIDSVAPAAKAAAARWGVPASVTIAQAIDESGWGKSYLSREYHNYFGIKFNSHQSGVAYVRMATNEVIDGASVKILANFMNYPSAEKSFAAHGCLLATAPRYSPAMDDSDDPFEFATQLRVCGYSTDPAYAAKLGKLITEFHLTQYDKPKDPPAAAAVAA
jgi:flagellum-specific peptidoglycan hydrolase FlgJ